MHGAAGGARILGRQPAAAAPVPHPQSPHVTVETTVTALQEGARESFYFFHMGRKKYCFDAEGSLPWRKLAVGEQVRIQGSWSLTADDVFEADSIVPLA